MTETNAIRDSWFDFNNISPEMKEIMGDSMETHIEKELRARKANIEIMEELKELKSNLEHKIILDIPEIPQSVASFIESFDEYTSIFVATEQLITMSSYKSIYDWYINNTNDFNIAWMYDYTVLKEDRYIVVSQRGDNKTILVKDAKDSSAKVMPLVGEFDESDANYHFTESQIKMLAPGLWDDRVKVEE